MVDVSCQPASVLVEGAIARGATLADLLTGLDVDERAILAGTGWLAWENYHGLMENALHSVGEAGIVEIGRTSFHGRVWRYALTVASLFWSPGEFWTFGVKGPVSKLYPCLTFSVEAKDSTSVSLSMAVSAGRRPSWPLALAFKGQALSVAEMFGYTEAEVEIVEIDNGHRITTRWPSRQRWRTRMSRLFQARRFMRFAAEDVLTTRSELLQRLQDLEMEIRERRAVEQDLRREMSEREALAEQVKRTHRLHSVGLLAGGVAHDFNNLLTVIRGNTELALLQEGLAADVRDSLNGALEASEHAAQLAQKLLAFGRPQEKQLEHLDLNLTLAQIDALVQRVIPAGMILETRFSGSPCTVYADRGQIEQVVLNLCLNARDASPADGTIVVSTSAIEIDHSGTGPYLDGHPGHYVELTVSDDGAGMSAETRDQIFEPFYTTKAEGEGNGLGLSMVMGIVGELGGFIDVDSQLGVGTTLSVFLPQSTAVV